MELTKSEKELLADFPEPLRDAIKQGSETLVMKKYEPSHESIEDVFILFYAFYKDDAYTRRLRIPTYREMHKNFQKKRAYSQLLFAYDKKMPVAVLWVSQVHGQFVLQAGGCIARGYELHADMFLFWEAVTLAKKLQLRSVSFDSSSLFHGIIGL